MKRTKALRGPKKKPLQKLSTTAMNHPRQRGAKKKQKKKKEVAKNDMSQKFKGGGKK